ncbi:MAG: hypothetical protein IPN98_07475 [Propionivibrio sp.]|nr:hypothetical protein [Propionivibrio sp.]
MTEKKRKPKAAGPRTEVFALRLDPKLKYLAEIAARKQRRSLANFVEWSLDEALANVKLGETGDFNGKYERSVRDEAHKLWDLEPSDRLIKLAENYPDLLTYEEQLIWKAIFEIRAHTTHKDDAGKTQVISYDFLNEEGNIKRADRSTVKECWSSLVDYAAGNATEENIRAVLKETIPF